MPNSAFTEKVSRNGFSLYPRRRYWFFATLFVSLKGPKRGQPMSPAGLRSLFRHHRRRTNLLKANPHRFRHTFGAEMVRAGVSLPALMHLMGHSQIHTTMRYVRLAPEDVWCEFARAVELRNRQDPSPKPGRNAYHYRWNRSSRLPFHLWPSASDLCLSGSIIGPSTVS